jgi:polyhydroxyalkanoate synthesis regulator phasin
MEQEIEKRVLVFTKQIQDRMVEETGIEPSLTEDETKRYLEQVIREVKKQKTSHGTRNSNNL